MKYLNSRKLSIVLILLLLLLHVHGQKPEDVKVGDVPLLSWSFETKDSKAIDQQVETFVSNAKKSGSRGLAVFYGTKSETELLTQIVGKTIRQLNIDPANIEFRLGGNVSGRRVDLWIIPPGADPPKLEPEGYVVAEFGRLAKAEAVRIIRKYFGELANNWNSQGYVINYGTDAQIALREKWIASVLFTRSYDRSRITLVRGGRKGGLRTVMWIVPPGAANPTP